jgi:hypothetical protein
MELNRHQFAIIEKVKKLLALAANNPSEAEAESATAKAMELLEAHNLSMHHADSNKPRSSNRDDKHRKGGLYGWQRKLWEGVCQLNFCMYWSIKGLKKGSTYEHRILGRQEIVIGAEIMAEYLQQTIERLAQRWAKDEGYNSCFVREAIAYREGMATRLTERLRQLRWERLQAEKRKAEEEQRAHPASGSALVLADTIDDETWLNYDHLYGREPGSTKAMVMEQRLRQREADKNADAMLAARDEAERKNPALKAAREAAEKMESEKWQKKWEKMQQRAPTAEELRAALPSFRTGYRDAEAIGLDQQIDKKTSRAIL